MVQRRHWHEVHEHFGRVSLSASYLERLFEMVTVHGDIAARR
jgi:hypothetical protein